MGVLFLSLLRCEGLFADLLIQRGAFQLNRSSIVASLCFSCSLLVLLHGKRARVCNVLVSVGNLRCDRSPTAGR